MKPVLFILALSSLLAYSGCTPGTAPPPVPDNAPMGWQRKSMDSLGARGDCRKIWRVEYAGGGVAHVDVCQTKSDSTGLDMQQTFKARANTVTFFNNRYFVIVNWDAGDQAAITALVKQLEKSLKVD